MGRVLFISFREPLNIYTNDLKKQCVDWSKVDFHYACVPDLGDLQYDTLIIDGASLFGLDVLALFSKFANKKILITVDSSDKILFEFLARRCQTYLICSSLETGLSKRYDGTLRIFNSQNLNSSTYLYKFGDSSLQLVAK
jgi:hypothetical protein